MSKEKRSKFNYQKTWQGLLKDYNPDMTKHFQVWTLQTKQVIIASESYINESEKRLKLLSNYLLEKCTLLEKMVFADKS